MGRTAISTTAVVKWSTGHLASSHYVVIQASHPGGCFCSGLSHVFRKHRSGGCGHVLLRYDLSTATWFHRVPDDRRDMRGSHSLHSSPASSSFARRVGNAAPVIGVGHASQLHAFQDDKQTALIAGQQFQHPMSCFGFVDVRHGVCPLWRRGNLQRISSGRLGCAPPRLV